MAATASTAEEDGDGDDDALQALPVSGAAACTMTVAVLGLKVALSHYFPRFWIGGRAPPFLDGPVPPKHAVVELEIKSVPISGTPIPSVALHS
jgi:hypothetical protein